MKEIERTFILDMGIKEILETANFLKVEQVKEIEVNYVINGSKEMKIIREEGFNPNTGLELKYRMIFKAGEGSKRVKIERELTPEEYYELHELSLYKKDLKKILYILYDERARKEYAVSSYKKLKLDLIEVEFSNDEREAWNYTKPSWFGTEVTESAYYRCKNLIAAAQ